MSTKTNFKRIALVAVASLGFGLLSAAPSNSAVNADTLTIKNTAGTTTSAITVANGETITVASSATATLSFLPGTQPTDSVTLVAALVSAPTGATALPYMSLRDTTSSIVTTGFPGFGTPVELGNGRDTPGSGDDSVSPNTIVTCAPRVLAVVSSCVFDVYLGRGSATAGATVAGTYVVTVKAANRDGSTSNAGTATITFTVGAATVSTTSGTAYMTGTVSGSVTMSTEDLIPVMATKAVSTAPKALIKVTQVSPSTANESVTATVTGPGTLGSGANNALATGRSILVKNGDTITVWADGTGGVATITLVGSTSGYNFGTKTVTWTGTSIAKIVATALAPVVNATGGSASVATYVQAYDSEGKQIYAPTIYMISSDLTKISNNYTSCTAGWDGTDLVSYCGVTAVSSGTSDITFSTHTAAGTYQGDGVTTTKVTSNAVKIRVGSITAASFKMSFDKATYGPGEKATLTVTPVDAAGLPVAGVYGASSSNGNAAYANFFATGGITSDYAFYTGSDTTTATFLNPSYATGIKTFTVYMPLQGSKITVKASAGAHFGANYQTTTGATTGTPVSATATVATEGAAALAAVTALATTVAALKTLITTLTNLVLKIQKKVKA
jgi:hypothetical protein